MGFFSVFDAPANLSGTVDLGRQTLDEAGNQPQHADPFWLGGGPGGYRARADAANAQLRAEQDERKRQEAAQEHAAFQQQANPLSPQFTQGLAEDPAHTYQVDWAKMQRDIYGG